MIAQNYGLFYPMLAIFLWTFLVALRNIRVRIGALWMRDLT